MVTYSLFCPTLYWFIAYVLATSQSFKCSMPMRLATTSTLPCHPKLPTLSSLPIRRSIVLRNLKVATSDDEKQHSKLTTSVPGKVKSLFSQTIIGGIVYYIHTMKLSKVSIPFPIKKWQGLGSIGADTIVSGCITVVSMLYYKNSLLLSNIENPNPGSSSNLWKLKKDHRIKVPYSSRLFILFYFILHVSTTIKPNYEFDQPIQFQSAYIYICIYVNC
jgi:hypothetical protein